MSGARWIRKRALRLAWIGLLCGGTLAQAATPVLRGDALRGRDKADSERCVECHSPEARNSGASHGPDAKAAKLAGQLPDYIVKQLRDFRSGARKHDFMAIMARSIDDEDAADIAAYFSSLPAMQGDGSDGGGNAAIARELYLRGDAARDIAACIGCHGESGKGKAAGGTGSPLIGGQQSRYLEKQLLDWRSGERRNSAGGEMTRAAKALTEREIEALAKYLAGL